ncbi:MAG: histidine--tRNA ligase [Myxococcota bacterium]|jgi:histidyl-tRNA synthetase
MGEQAVRCVRGMKDLLPADSRIFTAIEGEMRRVFGSFGFCEIRTPLVEETRLFSRGIGEETDIVSKEMYTFPDRDGSLLTLRPEGTASAVRAYIEHSFDRSDPVQRWYYTGAMFRHERPQKGRYRQFHQIGAESFGVADPFADAELIHMLLVFMAALKVAGVALRINSLGCPVCRPAFREKLRTFMESRAAELCDDCKRRIVTNPLRVLDCKQERCIAATAGAPASSENLCQECAVHFTGVQNALAAFGDTWSVDNRMVRGLDYYNRTTFELLATDPEAGAQNAVAGGGRYDALVEMLGGRATPAVGFAIGLERLRMLVAGAGDPALPAVSVFILAGSRATIREAATLASVLRGRGIPVELDGTDRGFKAKFKRADKSGARIAVIIGEDEAARGTCAV